MTGSGVLFVMQLVLYLDGILVGIIWGHMEIRTVFCHCRHQRGQHFAGFHCKFIGEAPELLVGPRELCALVCQAQSDLGGWWVLWSWVLWQWVLWWRWWVCHVCVRLQENPLLSPTFLLQLQFVHCFERALQSCQCGGFIFDTHDVISEAPRLGRQVARVQVKGALWGQRQDLCVKLALLVQWFTQYADALGAEHVPPIARPFFCL